MYLIRMRKALVDLLSYLFWYLPFLTIVLFFVLGQRHLFPVSHSEDDHPASAEIFNAGADMRYIGDMYYSGIGINSNKQIAANWYSKASETGDGHAAYLLGKMIMTGEIEGVDGIKSIRRGAELGNAEAQNFLGICLLNGQGTAKDQTEAYRWFTKAADQGLAEAQKNAGLMFFHGYGTLEIAVNYLNQAANKGIAEAQTRLGLMYEDGEYLGKNIPAALFWYQKAAEQHDLIALRRLHDLSSNNNKARMMTSGPVLQHH